MDGIYKKTEELVRGVAQSSYVISCWKEEELIALARVVSDDFSIVYVQDIIVAPQHQRQGIGRELVERCLERYRHVRQKVLLTDDRPEQLKFYKSLGFSNTKDLKKTVLNSFVRIEGANLS